MPILDLTSANWTLQAPDSREWLTATVPGCVHTDLLRHKLIEDPFWGQNELDLQWMEERDWHYRCEFQVSASLFAEEEIDLVFEGLDTVATVKLNGTLILESDNMFHSHRLPVKKKLKRGSNRLEIKFGSAMEYIRTQRQEFSLPYYSNDPIGGAPRIRKQPNQFGWDWGPRLVTAGVWRPARLEAWSGNRLESVRITQEHSEEFVKLTLAPELAKQDADARFRATLSFDGKNLASAEGNASDLTFSIKNPRLWWPHGQGEQPLYTLRVELLGVPEATWSRKIGLRQIVLDREADGFSDPEDASKDRNRFGLRVNGRLIFAKGANWIPAHAFVHNLTRADYEPLLRSAVDVHMNIIRLWGGGIYEHDCFYELCDELGLLVWHDFMFACNLYPSDTAFLESVRREAEENVRRVRHHASLALWCGNNELVMCWRNLLESDKSYADGYVKLFHTLLPSVLERVDPVTNYLPSSPDYVVPGYPELASASRDEHDWDVWHGRAPVEHYETKRHRFVSEFGMQSFPQLPVARSFCPPEELNIFSPIFQNHQKNSGGNGTILDYTMRLYRFPKDYASMAYLSQLNQAYCMKSAIEHFRRQQPRCLGAIYWQINDCWPVASWSSLEFGGRWKAIHHAARRFFAPSLVSVRHLGKESVRRDNLPLSTKGVLELWTSHDAPSTRRAILEWTLLTLDGAVLASGNKSVTLRPGESTLQKSADFSKILDRVGRHQAVLKVELSDAKSKEELSCNTAFFVAPRMLPLRPSPLKTSWKSVAPGEWDLTLKSSDFQPGVWLEFENPAVRVTDNAFDLFPASAKVVRVTLPAGRKATSTPPVMTLRRVSETPAT